MQRIDALSPADSHAIGEVINDAARAYKGVIPPDRWKEPYMSADELTEEIEAGIRFHGWVEDGVLIGIAGIQHVGDVDLIRHCYVRTAYQGRGIGGALLLRLVRLARTSDILVGTWEAAMWAIRFYERHGFELVPGDKKDSLLQRYWRIPRRQIETSIVLRYNKKW